MTDILTSIVIPVLIVILGLVLEYWVVQPIRRATEAEIEPIDITSKEQSDSQPLSDGKEPEIDSRIIPWRSYWISTVLLIFIAFSVYYVWLRPSLYVVVEREFYHYYSLRSGGDIEIVAKIPKYVYGGETRTMVLQIENNQNFSMENMEISVELDYPNSLILLPPDIPNQEMAIHFDEIESGQHRIDSLQLFILPGLPDGELIFATIIVKFDDGSYGDFGEYDFPERFLDHFELQINRYRGLISIFAENALLGYWANLLVVGIVFLSSLVTFSNSSHYISQLQRKNIVLASLVLLLRECGAVLVIVGLIGAMLSEWVFGIFLLLMGTMLSSISFPQFGDFRNNYYWKFLMRKRYTPQTKLQQLIPTTMLQAMLYGITWGAVLALLVQNFLMSYHRSRVCILAGQCLSGDEFIGVLIGFFSWLIIALVINGYIAAGFIVGKGLAYSIGIILVSLGYFGSHSLLWTLTGHVVWAIILGMVSIIVDPLLKKVGNVSNLFTFLKLKLINKKIRKSKNHTQA